MWEKRDLQFLLLPNSMHIVIIWALKITVLALKSFFGAPSARDIFYGTPRESNGIQDAPVE